jgi:hypothetical protein
MRFPAAAGAVGLGVRVTVEDEPGDLASVGALGLGVQEAQIGDEMRFVIGRDRVGPRYLIANVGIEFKHDPASVE